MHKDFCVDQVTESFGVVVIAAQFTIESTFSVTGAAETLQAVDNRCFQSRFPSNEQVHSTALAVLGHTRRQHQDWFDYKDAAVSSLLAEKNLLHNNYVDRPTDGNKAAFYLCRRLAHQRLRAMQDARTVHEAEYIQGLNVYLCGFRHAKQHYTQSCYTNKHQHNHRQRQLWGPGLYLSSLRLRLHLTH
nr:unnamed protein product [Spirometra erinaceieuropaei]